MLDNNSVKLSVHLNQAILPIGPQSAVTACENSTSLYFLIITEIVIENEF